MSSVGSEAGSEGSNTSRHGEIVKTGYLKKLKTMKKKFFVLRADSTNFPACLEYYDSGKKWKNKHPPKRSIILKNCFNVSRRTDTKYKYVIALFTGTECFGIVLECEDDLQEWLRLLITFQGEDVSEGCTLNLYYEHVWRVTIQKRELACKHNLNGIHLLCLTECTLSLVKPALKDEHEPKVSEFSLQSIRRCGNLDSVFYMELGQASCLGPGNLWMQAEDSHAAHHMHSLIMNACSNCPKKEMLPKCRSRSSSANEASKPIYFGRKWPSSGDDCLSVLSYPKSQSHQDHSITSPNSSGHSVSSVGDGIHHCHHNLTSVSFSPYPPTRRASTGTRPVTSGPALLSSGRTGKSYIARERCDSLPTRPRMTLDALSSVRNGNTATYPTSISGRPPSMFNRSIFSSAGCSQPTSPISATYSTDSAGSSLSVDADSENWSEMELRKSIPEERSEEYVQWGGNENNAAQNNTSVGKNIKSVCPHSSSNSQISCSPCSCSPMDAGAYIPMSPIEPTTDSRTRQPSNRSCDSMNHSRESSIHEEVSEGYVPMAPLSVDAGYISMDQSGRKQGELSPGLSSCSITSGTPSTDCRLSEFHLDKVSSYLTPSEDDIIFHMRPTRAYSTGSKPDSSHNKCVTNRCEAADGMRTRAFSVGSRCSSNLPTTPRRTPNSTSTSSIEHCDDLMEIDYSANRIRRRHLPSRVKHQGVIHTSAEKLTVPHSAVTLASLTIGDDYMDMTPNASSKSELLNDSRVSDTNLSPPRLSKHLIGRSPPTHVNYSKQAFARGSPVSSNSGFLEKVVEAESMTSRNEGDVGSYMDMKPGVRDVPDAGVVKVIPVIATATNLHARKDSFTVVHPANTKWQQTTCTTPSTVPHIKQPLLDTHNEQFLKSDKLNNTSTSMSKSTPDCYVDMSFKGRRIENQLTKAIAVKAPVAEKTPDGYVDMSFNKNSRKNLVDSNSGIEKSVENKVQACGTGKENQLDARQSSKPIAIQHGKNRRSGGSGFFRRYKAEETQVSKPNFLPLGLNISASFSSLGRKKKMPQNKDKSESPMSNAPTIFPLSPDRALDRDLNSKCRGSVSSQNVQVANDHEVRSLERVDEMVNCAESCKEENVEEISDYMEMTPGVAPRLQRKISEPTCSAYAICKATNSKEEALEDECKILYRSTSVPLTMSGMKGWKRSPSTPEFTKYEDETKCRSECQLTTPSKPAEEITATRKTPASQYNVPNSCPTASVLRSREKVTYATLDLPPAEAEQDTFTKADITSSSSKLCDQSSKKLTYAQIDFEKPCCSSLSNK